MTRFNFFHVSLRVSRAAAVICLLVCSNAGAAVITWGTVDGTNAISDIDTVGDLATGITVTGFNSGSMAAAGNAGGDSPQTVNGVAFVAEGLDPYGAQFSGALPASVAGFSAGDPIFDMLNTLSFGGGTGEVTALALSDLTVGLTYRVQLFFADRRFTGRRMQFGDGLGNNVTLQGGTVAGNVMGQNVIGTFTANATTQSITSEPLDMGNSHLNAYQIRVVPEPQALILAALGIAAIGLRIRSSTRSSERP